MNFRNSLYNAPAKKRLQFNLPKTTRERKENGGRSGVKKIEPHHPRTTPTKAMMNITSAILGLVFFVLLSYLGSDNSYTIPSKSHSLDRKSFVVVVCCWWTPKREGWSGWWFFISMG